MSFVSSDLGVGLGECLVAIMFGCSGVGSGGGVRGGGGSGGHGGIGVAGVGVCVFDSGESVTGDVEGASFIYRVLGACLARLLTSSSL